MAQVLTPLTATLKQHAPPELLAGIGVPDDAAVYQLDDERALIATIDFFTPIVDDPHTYGAIAAANAMSDVYAMGGEVVLALNVAAFPEDLPPGVITEVLRGAADKVIEAGGIIAGGHTIWDSEPKFGLSVTGLAHPARLFGKGGLQPGDTLYLTKPLGTGTLMSAARSDQADGELVQEAIDSMCRLNRHAAHLAHAAGVRAATDVTGFGLLGHAWEMAATSGVALEIDGAAVPMFEGALQSAEAGFHTGGESRNRAWLTDHITVAGSLGDTRASLLFDPQTSGGLLIGCPADGVDTIESAAARDSTPLWRIGRVVEGEPHITVI